MRAPFLLLPAFLLSACASANAGGSEITSSRQLTGDELRALLSDAHIAPLRSPELLISHPPGENFLANGVYQRIVGRTILEGTYEIQDAIVCVAGADFDRQCRKIVPQQDGKYALVDQRDGSAALVTISPLQ